MLEEIRENEQPIGMLPYRISMLRQPCYIFKFSKKKLMAKTTRLEKSSFLNLHEIRRCQKLSGSYLLKPLSAIVALI